MRDAGAFDERWQVMSSLPFTDLMWPALYIILPFLAVAIMVVVACASWVCVQGSRHPQQGSCHQKPRS